MNTTTRSGVWIARIATALIVPVFFLLILEGALRLTGNRVPTSFFVRNQGGQGWTTNLRFGWRFFPPRVARWPSAQVLEMPKPAGTFRVFTLGSSAAFGTPSEQFSFSRILGAMLEARFPGTRFEMANTAMTAINSHVVLPIARDCAKMQPDLYILYMGNNEVVGPYGAGSVFGRRLTSTRAVRAHIALRSTATAQLLSALADPKGNLRGAAPEWKGLAQFMNYLVPADDPRLDTVYTHFRNNLRDIRDVARKSGAPIVACTVASNLRDSAPFATVHRPGLSHNQLIAYDNAINLALDAFHEGAWAKAAEQFRAALALDDRAAEAHYFLAKSLDAAGMETETARQEFIRARDLDALRVRCDSRLNEIVREVMAPADGVALADLERDLGADRPPGSEWFYEHVHFRFAGNYLVARLLFDQVEPLVARALGQAPDPAFVPPSQEACAERIGWTRVEEASCEQFMLEDMVAQAPFTNQRDHERDLAARRAAFVAAYGDALAPESIDASLAAVRRALEQHPDDLFLRKALLDHDLVLKRRPEAIEQLKLILQAIPSDYLMLTKLGGQYQHLGENDEAAVCFRKALELNPYYYVARNNLAVIEHPASTNAPADTGPERQ